ncbi:hypothetical protein D3C80_1995680 [compost metagenome]
MFTIVPAASVIDFTTPSAIAEILDSIFMASIIKSGWFFFTLSPTLTNTLDNNPCNGEPI